MRICAGKRCIRACEKISFIHWEMQSRSQSACQYFVDADTRVAVSIYPKRDLLFQGFHAIHFAKCSPTQSNVRRAMLAVQDSMPFRLFSVHFLHAPSSITSILNIFYPLLKEKLIHKVSRGLTTTTRWNAEIKSETWNCISRVCSFTSTTVAAKSCTLIWTRTYFLTNGAAKRALYEN